MNIDWQLLGSAGVAVLGVLLTHIQLILAQVSASGLVLTCRAASPREWVMELKFREPMHGAYMLDERQLLVTFNMGIGEINLGKILVQCSDVLENAESGYDTLLLKAKPYLQTKVEQHGNSIRVILKRGRDPVNRTLQLSRIRLLSSEGDSAAAFALLDSELSTNITPSYDLLLAGAALESQAQRPHAALRYLNQAFSLQEPDFEASRFRDELSQPLLPYIALQGDYTEGGSTFHEWIETFSARSALWGDSLSGDTFSFSAAVNSARFTHLQKPDGSVGDEDVTRSRFELKYLHPFGEENSIAAGLLAGHEKVGALGELKKVDRSGSWFGTAAWQEPYWDFASTVAFRGVRDLLRFGRTQKAGPRLAFELSGAFNRFDIDGNADIAEGEALNALVTYILKSSAPTVTLNYQTDAQYFLKREKRRSQTGQEFSLLGVDSYEFHALSMGASHDLSHFPYRQATTQLSAFGGYSVDRLGEATAPNFGGILKFWKPRGPELRLQAARTFSTFGGSNRQTRVIAGLAWRF